MVKIETNSHVISAGEAAASYVIYNGSNQGSFTYADGQAISPKEDRRVLRSIGVTVERANGVVVGCVASLVTLTGTRGREWLAQLGPLIQQNAGYAVWHGECPVLYGWGVLFILGAVAAGDEIRMRCIYE